MSVGITKEDRYETKTVTFSNPERAEGYMVMMVGFDGTGHQTLEQYGFHGRYVMFIVETGAEVVAENDPHKLKMEVGSDDLADFLSKVRSGYRTDGDKGISWDSIEDGGVYHPL